MTKRWTNRFKQPTQAQATAQGTIDLIKRAFGTLGEEVDGLIAEGVAPDSALERTAQKLDSPEMQNAFRAVYRDLRREHFTDNLDND